MTNLWVKLYSFLLLIFFSSNIYSYQLIILKILCPKFQLDLILFEIIVLYHFQNEGRKGWTWYSID
jgi:hypothetical protein